ncbi:MAG: TonB-dependent receptor, partial [Bryobacterales bacterium]|nr:TonB-dependent receptor [Bryobacterales bacterium]
MDLRKALGVLCLLAAGALAAFGQTYGEITGTVTDPSGAAVTTGTVKVTNQATNQVRTVPLNQAGNYTIPFLVPGVYNVQVEIQGFKTAARPNVEVQVGSVVRINFALEIGAITQTIEVSGGAPLLETESTAVGTVVENKRIVELPLNGRNYLQLIALSPNVTHEMGAGGQGDSRQGGDRANQNYSIAGQRQQFNHFTLDGVENTDVNFNTFVVRPSVDALQEFKVQTGVYSAEFGRATSQINATTKPGGNQFHGTVFEFLRNDKLDAKEWRNAGDKNPFRRNQYGFTLAGRLIRDKLFFMSNFEGLKDRKTLQGITSVATDRMRAGDLSQQSRRIFDPLTRTYTVDANGVERAVSALPFPNQTIPESRFHPIARKLLGFYPTATTKGDSILRNYIRNRPRPISWEQFTGRIDYNESSNSSWFGRLSWGDEYVGQLATFPEHEGRTLTKVYQTLLSNTRTFGPSIVNEARFGYNKFHNDQILNFYSGIRDVTAELGIGGLTSPDPVSWGTPNVSLQEGLSGWGGDATGPFTNRNHVFQFLDNVSVVRGAHSIKFGGEIRRDRFNQAGNDRVRGTVQFGPKASFDPANRNSTGHSFADFLLGEVQRATRAVGTANAMLRASSFALYLEDTWKITPRLTMNYGLRYENSPPWYDKYRGIMNVQLFGSTAAVPTPILTRPGSGDFYDGLPFRYHDGLPVQAGDQFLGRALVNRDDNDFAPRLGFSYSPNNRWAFRTGVGVFYSQDTGNPRFDMARNQAGRDDAFSNEERPSSNLSAPWQNATQQYKCADWSGACLGPPYSFGNIVERRTPYVFQWVFNVQRQLTENLALELGYQGNAGHKLERLRSYGDALPRTGPTDGRSIEQRRIWPAYARIQEVDGSVNSNYNALNVKLQQRFSRGLTYLVGYTWSKAIDGGSAIRTNSGDRLFPADNNDLARERSLSQFHTGRRLVTSILYELPFGPGKAMSSRFAVINHLVGGWQLGSVMTFSDGTPYNVGSLGDNMNIGTEGNYPHATGISPIPENRTTEKFWEKAAFDPLAANLTYTFGNVGRNVLVSPGLRQVDFSAMKKFRIRESHSLDFRFEAFNFTNHPNWNAPS